jgi:hypothetical protein
MDYQKPGWILTIKQRLRGFEIFTEKFCLTFIYFRILKIIISFNQDIDLERLEELLDPYYFSIDMIVRPEQYSYYSRFNPKASTSKYKDAKMVYESLNGGILLGHIKLTLNCISQYSDESIFHFVSILRLVIGMSKFAGYSQLIDWIEKVCIHTKTYFISFFIVET